MTKAFDLTLEDGIAVGVAHGRIGPDDIKASAASMWRMVEGPAVSVFRRRSEALAWLSAGFADP